MSSGNGVTATLAPARGASRRGWSVIRHAWIGSGRCGEAEFDHLPVERIAAPGENIAVVSVGDDTEFFGSCCGGVKPVGVIDGNHLVEGTVDKENGAVGATGGEQGGNPERIETRPVSARVHGAGDQPERDVGMEVAPGGVVHDFRQGGERGHGDYGGESGLVGQGLQKHRGAQRDSHGAELPRFFPALLEKVERPVEDRSEIHGFGLAEGTAFPAAFSVAAGIVDDTTVYCGNETLGDG